MIGLDIGTLILSNLSFWETIWGILAALKTAKFHATQSVTDVR